MHWCRRDYAGEHCDPAWSLLPCSAMPSLLAFCFLDTPQGSEAFLIDRWRQYVQSLMVDLAPGIVLGSISAAGFLAFVAWVSGVRALRRSAANHRSMAGGPLCVYEGGVPPSASVQPGMHLAALSCRQLCAGGAGMASGPQGWPSGRLGELRRRQQLDRQEEQTSRHISSS